MDGRTHSAVGAASGLLLAQILPNIMIGDFNSVCVGVGASIIGALFPDLDLRRSSSGKLLGRTLSVVFSIGILLGIGIFNGMIDYKKITYSAEQALALCTFWGLVIFSRTRPHREFTHSFLGMGLATFCILVMFQGFLWVWFGVGYFSHLMVDILNRKGEHLFFPVKGSFCLGVCTADGMINHVLRYVGVVIAGLLLVIQGGA